MAARRFDEDRRNKYFRSAQAWLALVAQAAHRRTTTYDALGALLLNHPLTLRSDLDPIDDYCNEHGLPPLAVVMESQAHYMESPHSLHGIPDFRPCGSFLALINGFSTPYSRFSMP